jgi:hypothetical protein
MWNKLIEIFPIRTLLIFGDFLLYALSIIMLYLVCSLNANQHFFIGTNAFFFIFILILILKDLLSYLIGKLHTENKIIDFFLTSLDNAIKNEEKTDNIMEGKMKKGGIDELPIEPPPSFPPEKQ